MRRSTSLLATLVVFVCLSTMPVAAQHSRPGSGRPSGSPSPPSTPGRPAPSERPSTSGSGKVTKPEAGGPSSGKTVNDLLKQNTKLSSQIGSLTGMTAQDACSGFKNLGECVAAAHVSKNLGIDFNTLKGKVTGPNSGSLGQAIHEFNPTVDAKAEANKARKQAKEDMKDISS